LNILIIDDEINICFTLKGILEDEGYSCFLDHNGKDGLNTIESLHPDLVILDVKLEGMNGIEVLKKIKHFDVNIEVIMISGHSGISEAVQAIKLGAYDFLEKPLTLPKVKFSVKKALEFKNINQHYKRFRASENEKYEIIGSGEKIKEIKNIIRKVATSKAKVLIRGESGSGKELIAYAIHNNSSRAEKAFIKFNSAAIPTELVESELFGFEKGAFTGAIKSRKGKLEEADGGTLFLDEIGDMSLSAQAKILRVIQEGEFERIGSNKTQKIDARIIAATHKNLEKMVEEGLFREDLFYRLNVVPIYNPPLREHPEDIPILIEHFSKIFAGELNFSQKIFLPDAIRELQTWEFKGNIRELKNMIERIYILAETDKIGADDIPIRSAKKAKTDWIFWLETSPFSIKKKEFEKKYLTAQLSKFDNNISQTAKALDLHQSNLSRKLKELDIKV